MQRLQRKRLRFLLGLLVVAGLMATLAPSAPAAASAIVAAPRTSISAISVATPRTSGVIAGWSSGILERSSSSPKSNRTDFYPSGETTAVCTERNSHR